MPSSNLISTGVSLTFASSICFALLGVAEAIAALLSTHWFHYSASSSNSLDLWKSCVGDTNCTDYVFVDVNRELCTLSGSEFQGRIFTLRALIIAAAILLFMYSCLVVIGVWCCDSLGAVMGAVACSTLSLFCFAAEVGLFSQTAQNYFFCGLSPCDFYKALGSRSPCYTMMGGAFGLVWTAGAASLCATCLGCAAMYRMRRPGRLEKLNLANKRIPDARDQEMAAIAGRHAPQQYRTTVQSAPGTGRSGSVGNLGPFKLKIQRPIDAWRMEAEDYQEDESGYLYSASANLYFDENDTKLFFDPTQHAAGRPAWYDPSHRTWH